jgi:nicotinamide phosphoribosyltransferase
LGQKFPVSANAKGFKVLDPHVRLSQGDGIEFQSLGKILEAVTNHGWSADNLVFGSDGGLLQKVNRDTLKFAFKCSSIEVNGEARDVFKRHVTDTGKRSKSGRLKLICSVSLGASKDTTHGRFKRYQSEGLWLVS